MMHQKKNKLLDIQNTILLLIIFIVILLNIRPGFVLLGNDNFSPEVNPQLTVARSILSPAWRTYRALGVASDSEQSDIFRSTVFLFFEKIHVPTWIISQGYLFFCFGMALFSAGILIESMLKKQFPHFKYLRLLGGLFYVFNLLGVWIFFSPVQLFVAAFSFLPFVIFRILKFGETQNITNFTLLILASFLFLPSALTATMFLVCFVVICFFCVLFLMTKRMSAVSLIKTMGIFCIIQLFWLLPFIIYVRSNTTALKDSLIYRKITPTMIENEVRYNTPLNTLLYKYAWLDTKENDSTFSYKYHDWYANNAVVQTLSYLPLVLALTGALFLLKKKKVEEIGMISICMIGWFLIKGQNPPFGFIFSYLQDQFPVYFAQVFRWQSSKFWPLLALSLPFLSTYGAVSIFETIKNKYLRNIILMGIITTLLVYCYPFFKSYLVRDEAYVQVPQEYRQLKDFITKYDSNGRIYAAPEANTLYFRNYSWGFWGSVFLNYLLPNPVMEKALVIGSAESEDAFEVLHRAYYSNNQQIFTNTLLQYDVSYILSDKYSSKGFVGYSYDWEKNDYMIEQNPYFSKIWSSGKLSLFKVNPIYFPTHNSVSADRKRMGIIASKEGFSYIENKSSNSGRMYLFGLQYENWQIDPIRKMIVGTYNYDGGNIDYTRAISSDQLKTAPTATSFRGSSLVIKPAFPEITIDGTKMPVYTGEMVSEFNIPTRFATINFEVVENMQNVSRVISTAYADSVGALIKGWSDSPQLEPFSIWCGDNQLVGSFNLKKGIIHKCGTQWLTINADAIIEGDIELQSDQGLRGFICVNSKQKSRCLNTERYLFNLDKNKYHFLLPQIVDAGDEIQLLFEFESPKDSSVNVMQFNVHSYTNSYPIKAAQIIENPDSQSYRIGIQKGGKIDMAIPIIESANALYLGPNSFSYPEFFYSASSKNNSYFTVVASENGFDVAHKESNVVLGANLKQVKGDTAMIFALGTHSEGIPLEMRIKEDKQQFNLWENKLYPKQNSALFDLLYLPDITGNYKIELYSSAFGPHISKNTIGAFVFQSIPVSWYTMSLIPVNESNIAITPLKAKNQNKDESIFYGSFTNSLSIGTIPNSTSSNWNIQNIAVNNVEPIPIIRNGWQQGWIVEKGEYMVNFWPNTVVYYGYAAIILAIGVGLTLFFIKRKK